MKEKFKVNLLSEAVAFIDNLDEKTREKIIFNIKKSQFCTDNELFKKLTNTIWEFRTLYNKKAYRLFAFWDKDAKEDVMVIGTHCILKKTDKTPPKEIEKAEEIRKQYLNLKI